MKKLGTKVSRVLDPTNKAFKQVVFQPLRPPLDSEFNFSQDLQNQTLQDIVSNLTTSGFFELGPIVGRPVGGQGVWKNVILFKNSACLINGNLIHVGGGTNQFQPNALQNIWQQLSNDEDQIALILPAAPSNGSRDDLVWLEVWEELITPTKAVNKFGNSQSAETPFSNDLIDPNINRETSVRTQMKYRIRVSEGIDFVSFPNGIDNPSIFAEGIGAFPVAGYTFTRSAAGHYIAGAGTTQSQTDLGTVDGFVYGLPICAVHRRNLQAFNVSNANGSANVITDGVSDRPDGLFNDEINQKDIEDLRHLISLTPDHYSILKETMDSLVKGQTQRLVLGDRPDLYNRENLQIDGITINQSPNINVSLVRKPNAISRNWSDREITQRVSFYIQSGQINVSNQMELDPPVFYTSTDSLQYASLNPFIGAVKAPRIINAATGVAIAAATVTGAIKGWTNLGDRINKAAVFFTPQNASDIQGKQILVEYDLVIPAGTGLSQVPSNMLKIVDQSSTLQVPFTVDRVQKSELLTRTVNGFQDSQITRPISSFITPGTDNETFRGGVIERVYHTIGNGSSTITIPNALDGRKVMSVMRVQGAANGIDIALGFAANPKITRNADGSFTINFTTFFPTVNDTVRVTLLMSGTACEVVTRNRGLENFVKNQFLQITSTGSTQYVITPVNLTSTKSEFIYAMSGFYDGTTWQYAAYAGATVSSNAPVSFMSSAVNLGTGQITVTFVIPPPAGQIITIPVLGTYAPLTSDQYTIYYDYTPYQGLTGILVPGEELEAEVVYIADGALVTTSGTGGATGSGATANAAVHLPLNGLDADAIFQNQPLQIPNTQAQSSLKHLGANFDFPEIATVATGTAPPQVDVLRIGDTLVVKKQNTGVDKSMTRGGSLESPNISYRLDNLTEFVTEHDTITTQLDGANKVIKLQKQVIGVYDTVCLARVWRLSGQVVFTTASKLVTGLNAFFTRQLRQGMLIRPVGSTVWSEVLTVTDDGNLLLRANYTGASSTGNFELYMPQITITVNGTVLQPEDIKEVLGKDGIVILANAPQVTDNVVINYKTGLSTLNCIYGLAVGKGILEGELLMFALTTTSSIETVVAPEYNLLKEGRANRLIFNNIVPIVSSVGAKNEGNRVIVSADFFFAKTRRLNIKQKVEP